jgi:uncharacterized membrane protein YphA (DoxX/SURF4 family)
VNAIAQGVCSLTGYGQAASNFWPLGVFTISVGLVVMVGFMTPFACVVATLGYIFDGVVLFLSASPSRYVNAFTAFDLAAISMALVLLGPGAFSVDARLFGRREIIIPAGRRSPQ